MSDASRQYVNSVNLIRETRNANAKRVVQPDITATLDSLGIGGSGVSSAPATQSYEDMVAPIKERNKAITQQLSEANPSSATPEKKDERNFIQRAIDVLSVGNYTTANIANNMVDSAEQGKGFLDYLGDIGEGIGQGLDAAFNGNTNDNVKTWKDVNSRISDNAAAFQKDAVARGDMGAANAAGFWGSTGIDSKLYGEYLKDGDQKATDAYVEQKKEKSHENAAVTGLIGDIALDPLTYVSFGTSGAIRGGVRGLTAFNRAEKLEKAGMEAVAGAPGKYKEDVIARLSDDSFKADVRAASKANGTNLVGDSFTKRGKAAEIEAARQEVAKGSDSIFAVRERATTRREAIWNGAKEAIHQHRLNARAIKVGRAASNSSAAKATLSVGDIADDIDAGVANLIEAAKTSGIPVTRQQVVNNVMGRAKRMVRANYAANGGVSVSPSTITAVARRYADDLYDEAKAVPENKGAIDLEDDVDIPNTDAAPAAAGADLPASTPEVAPTATDTVEAPQPAATPQETPAPALGPSAEAPATPAPVNYPADMVEDINKTDSVNPDPGLERIAPEEGLPTAALNSPVGNAVEGEAKQAEEILTEPDITPEKAGDIKAVNSTIMANDSLVDMAMHLTRETDIYNNLAATLSQVKIPGRRTVKESQELGETVNRYSKVVADNVEELRKGGAERAVKADPNSPKVREAVAKATTDATKAKKALDEFILKQIAPIHKAMFGRPLETAAARAKAASAIDAAMKSGAVPEHMVKPIQEAMDKFHVLRQNLQTKIAKIEDAKSTTVVERSAPTAEDFFNAGVHPSDFDAVIAGAKVALWDGNVKFSTSLESIGREIKKVQTWEPGTPTKHKNRDKAGEYYTEETHPLFGVYQEIEPMVRELLNAQRTMTPIEVGEYLHKASRSGDLAGMAQLKTQWDVMNAGGLRGYLTENTANAPLITPVAPKQAEEFITVNHDAAVVKLEGLPAGIELRGEIDKAFAQMFGHKSQTYGNSTTSINRDAFTAKDQANVAGIYGTQSIYRLYSRIGGLLGSSSNWKRTFGDIPMPKGEKAQDATLLAALNYVDATLRKEGIDFTLDSFAIQNSRAVRDGDGNIVYMKDENGEVVKDAAGKPVPQRRPVSSVHKMESKYVRIGLADFASAISPAWRRKLFFARGKGRNRILPTQMLDLAEMAVRSASRLTEDGMINLKWAEHNMLEALKGTAFKDGARYYSHGPMKDMEIPESALVGKTDEEIRQMGIYYLNTVSGKRLGGMDYLRQNLGTILGRAGFPIQYSKQGAKDSQGAWRQTGIKYEDEGTQAIYDMVMAAPSAEAGYAILTDFIRSLGNVTDVEAAALLAKPEYALKGAKEGVMGELEELAKYMVRGDEVDGDMSPLAKLLQANLANTAMTSRFLDRLEPTTLEQTQKLREVYANGTPSQAIEHMAQRQTDFDVPADMDEVINNAVLEEAHKIAGDDGLTYQGKLIDKEVQFTNNPDKVGPDRSVINSADNPLNQMIGQKVFKEAPPAVQREALAEANEEAILSARLAFTKDQKNLLAGGLFNARYGFENTFDTVRAGIDAGTLMQTRFKHVQDRWKSEYKMTSAKLIDTLSQIKADKAAGRELEGINKEIYDTYNQIFDAGQFGFASRAGLRGNSEGRRQFYERELRSSFPDNWEDFMPAELNMHGKTRDKAMDSLLAAFKSTKPDFDGSPVGLINYVDNMLAKMSDKTRATDFGKKIAARVERLREANKNFIDDRKLEGWLNYDFKDPYGLADRFLGVRARTSSAIAMAENFSKGFGSTSKVKGYVQIKNTVGEKDTNIFADMIDHSRWYAPEVAQELRYWDKLLKTDPQIMNSTVDKFVRNVADPIISLLKMGQTTLKPGHHVMSLTGDMFRNFLLTNSPMTRGYSDAMKLMPTVLSRSSGKNATEMFRESMDQSLDMAKFTPSENGFKFTFRGKDTNIAAGDLVAAFDHYGVTMPRHSGGVLEDLTSGDSFTTMAEGWQRKVRVGSDKVQTFKPFEWANAAASHRDSFTRMALALHYMREKNFANLDEAIRYAAKKVKEAIPLASDLSTFEAKYMRRVVFYYTWMRGMTPIVMSWLLDKPGMATIGSKLQYNIAEFNGLDPESFGDPFSTEDRDRLPGYITERLNGPMWRAEDGSEMGSTLVNPVIDILNTWGSGISPTNDAGDNLQKAGQTLLGMSSPWLRTPWEVVSKTNMSTGTPIQSVPQYFQDMIGPLRTASKMTGENYFAPGGEGEGLFAARSESKYQKATPEDLNNLRNTELINFFTGGQVTNYSTDQLANSKKFEDAKQK